MASTILSEISLKDLPDSSSSPAMSITDVKHLSSYNWIEAATPTIAVPGSPALWSAPSGSQRVNKDAGLSYIAQNAARHPDSPLEPLFRALYVADPEFDICSIDVVTDRNNIRKLLSFIDPTSAKNGLEAFTIHVEVVEDTAIFSREETATHEIIGPNEFKGFGHEFEKAYTTNKISGSTGHQRILSYQLGDLKFVIRHETDGYVSEGTEKSSSSSIEPESNDLSSLLGSLSLSQAISATDSISTGSGLTIKLEGQVIPIEKTLEIKTRIFRKRLDISEVAWQLWISQTPKLVRAYHDKGVFLDPKVEDVAAQIKGWEGRNQANLTKLAVLIRKIIAVVKDSGGNAMVRYDLKKSKLIITRFDGKKMLPEDLYSKWSDSKESQEETITDQKTNLEGGVTTAEMATKLAGKRVISGPEDTKREESIEIAKDQGQALRGHQLLDSPPGETGESGIRDGSQGSGPKLGKGSP